MSAPAGRSSHRRKRLAPSLACGLLALGLGACAARERLPAVPAVVSPKYPEFVFPSAPDNTPPVVNSRHTRGWQFLQAGDLKNAEREFGAALKSQPAFYPSVTGLAYVDLAEKQAQRALGNFERALTVRADYVPALVGRGQALLELGRADEALASLEAALTGSTEVSPLSDVRHRVEVLRFQNVQALVTTARRAAAAGRHEQARQAYAKAIAASPDSPFLYRELGAVERDLGNLDQALDCLRQAAELDPADARSLVLMGEIYELTGDFDSAAGAYEKALARDESAEIRNKREFARQKAELSKLPAEYRAIAQSSPLTRGDLAALIGVNLGELLGSSRQRGVVVVTDTRNHWAGRWIGPVVSAGVMEVYPNHTFQPTAVVRRGDMAQALSRLLNVIAAGRPRLATEWQKARPRIADLSAGHLVYPDASVSVAAGLMPLLEGNTFQPTRLVNGAEATAAIARVKELAR